MKLRPWFVLLLAVCAQGANAERIPPRALTLGEVAEARVIVKFKPAAASVRAHALSASDPRATVTALEQRAVSLGARHGLRLRSGAALGERVQLVHGEPGSDGRALAARLAQDPDVEYAEVDRRARRTAVPNDPRFASVGGNGPAVGQWYLKAPAGDIASSIDAVAAWDITTGSASIIVAVLDTGVRPNHPDLAGKLIGGYDFVTDTSISNDGNGRDADPSDPGDWLTQAEINANPGVFLGDASTAADDCTPSSSSWHGTQVAGIIGAATNNGSGMAGAGWDVRVMPVRVLGKCFGYTSDITAAIRWAAGLDVPGVPKNPNPARVINLSLGSGGACSNDERDAIAAATAAGAVVVVAAGNSAGLAANSPANCPGAIGVAAVRHVGTKVGFSDVGPELSIAAPGGNCVNPNGACLYPILTTADSGSTTPAAPIYTDSVDASVGTSFSSPLVAATAALMLSVQAALTPAGVRDALRATARPFPSSGVADDPDTGPVATCRAPNGSAQLQCYCTTSTCGAGLLDAGAAVRAVTGVRVVIEVTPAAPVAGQPVGLSAANSIVAAGRSIAGWQWSLVDAGATGAVFAGSTNAVSANLQASAAGTAVVRLVITDDRGVAVASQQSIVVAAAPAPSPAAAGGGGGGAMAGGWLLALLLAAFALRTPLSRQR